MRMLVHIGLLFLTVLFLPSISSAQALGNFPIIEISLSPEYPKPGQVVLATVRSASENVRSSNVIWLLDGEIQQQGAGLVSFSFTAPSLGETEQLSVFIETPEGQALTKSVNVRPAQVTLAWEGDTYTPPFYEGLSLYSTGSLIRAQAFPQFVSTEGVAYSPSELIYTWSKNGTVLGSASGIGASSLVTQGPKFFGDYILGVEVTTPDNLQVASAAARVETAEPEALLYERDPLTGVQYHNALQQDHEFLGSSQFEIQAEPYFMDVIHANDDFLSYQWHVNGTPVFGAQEDESRVSIQLETEQDVSTDVTLTIEHAQHLLQTIKETYRIVFGGSARNSLFGF